MSSNSGFSHSGSSLPDSISKYYPSKDVEEEIAETVSSPLPTSNAFELFKNLVSMIRVNSTSFLLIGKLLKEFRDKKLFLKLDYKNFARFLESEELGFSREKAYMCIKTYEYYIEYMRFDAAEIGKLSVGRLSMMVPILKEITAKSRNRDDAQMRVSEKIDELTRLPRADFVREVKRTVKYDGRPSVYYSTEESIWIIAYHPENTRLVEIEPDQDLLKRKHLEALRSGEYPLEVE